MNEFIHTYPVLFQYMLRKKLKSFSFAVIVSVNIKDWQNKIGKGYLCSIYPSIKEAKKFESKKEKKKNRTVVEDIAVEVFVEMNDREKLKFSVANENTAIFDILNSEEINKITKFSYKKYSETTFKEAENFLGKLCLLSLSKRSLYLFAKSEKHIIQDLKEKINVFENFYNISSKDFVENINMDLNTNLEYKEWERCIEKKFVHNERLKMLKRYLSHFKIFVV